jgi:hypothetical protein
MRSPARKSSKPSRGSAEPNWTAIAWLALVLNCILGVLFSSSTGLQQARVIGAPPGDVTRIQLALGEIRKVPAVWANRTKILSDILANPELESATLSQNIFGRGVLRIKRKTIVAAVDGEKNLWLAEGGSLVRSADGASKVLIQFPPSARQPMSLTCAGSDLAASAVCCSRLATDFSDREWKVMLDERGVLSMRTAEPGRIIIGTPEKLEEKLSAIKDALGGNPKLLQQVKELNVSAPTDPVVVPIN